MRLVLGPYDLVSPSAASAVALTLGAEECGVITLAPAPLEGAGSAAVRLASDNAPRFLQLLDSWRWTAPLWRSGLLCADCDGESPLEEIRLACARIGADPQAAPLRALGGAGLFSDPDTYLETLSRDLLRGGGDPSVSIPLLAGIERFAARHGLPLVRLAGSSIAARLDKRSALTLARFTVPSIVGAAPVAYLETRRLLSTPLGALRSALQALIALTPTEAATHAPRLTERCAVYADAFSASARRVLDASAHAGEPARLAEIAVTVSLAPAGASFEAASRAAESFAPGTGRGSRHSRARMEAGPTTELNLPRMVVFTARPAPWDPARPS